MKLVFNVFTGTLDFVETTTTPAITDSIDTEGGDHLTTEADDLLIPEA